VKRLFLLLVCLSFLCLLASPAIAGSGRYAREEADQVGYVDTKNLSADGVISSVPCFVYAVTIDATSATAFVNLYDNATMGSGTVRIEVSETDIGDSKRYVFDKPVKFTNGVYADVVDGNVIVEYR